MATVENCRVEHHQHNCRAPLIDIYHKTLVSSVGSDLHSPRNHRFNHFMRLRCQWTSYAMLVHHHRLTSVDYFTCIIIFWDVYLERVSLKNSVRSCRNIMLSQKSQKSKELSLDYNKNLWLSKNLTPASNTSVEKNPTRNRTRVFLKHIYNINLLYYLF